MKSQPKPELISTSGIAALAGVSAAAVSQWRKRHEDFPKPVETKGRSTLFNTIEIERWLAANGRDNQQKESDSTRRKAKGPSDIFRILDIHRGQLSPNDYTAVLAVAAVLKWVETEGKDLTDVQSFPEELSTLINAMLEKHEGLLDALKETASSTELIAAASEETSRNQREVGMYQTPTAVSALAAALLPNSPENVLDFASGAGGTLAEVQGRFPESNLVGIDLDSRAIALAQARALVQGWSATWIEGDATQSGVIPAGAFDSVVAFPPIGVRGESEVLQRDPVRWTYEVPTQLDESRWLQLALHALKNEGWAVVGLAPGVLFQKRSSQILRKMAADGTLSGVIELPQGSISGSSLKAVLLVLQKNSTHPNDSVFYGRVLRKSPYSRGLDIESDAVLEAFAKHVRGEQIEQDEKVLSVPRLELVDSDTSLTVEYRFAQELQTDVSRLKDDFEQARSSDFVAPEVPKAIETLQLNATANVRIQTIESVKGVARIRVAPESPVPAGSVVVNGRNVEVVGEGEEKYANLASTVFSCDPELIDPWYLAGVIQSALLTGAIGVGLSNRIDPRSISVPALPLEAQRKSGELLAELHKAREQSAKVLQNWDSLIAATTNAAAAGLIE